MIATRLQRYLFSVIANPHGVVYNPISLSATLDGEWKEPELFLHDGMWRSLNHHSKLAGSSRPAAVELVSTAERLKARALESSDWLIVTLGTAQAFCLNGTGQVVANCHRLPQSLFQRRRLGPEECLQALRGPLHRWLDGNARRRVILTVSPVRYLRDGLIENNRGKAVLLLVCAELEKERSSMTYFPAYEIVVDELRSYRYFERDLCHPNELAGDIVWQHFAETYLDSDSRQALSEMDKLHLALSHRPSHQTDLQALAGKSLRRLTTLQAAYPQLDLSGWKSQFVAMSEGKTS